LVADERVLPTVVWAPLITGRLPLVVFAPGYGLGPEKYARFCRMLAAAGYLVAAPSFPLADPAREDGLDRGDIPNEAIDVSFVITSLLAGPVADHIDPGAIAVVGHSDGADVALMLGYEAGRVDSRIRAIVAISPDAMTGQVLTSTSPLLLVHGTGDTVVPYSNGERVFRQVLAKRYFLTMLGAGHYAPIDGGTPWTDTLDTATTDFLGATIAHDRPEGGLESDLDRLGRSRLVVGG